VTRTDSRIRKPHFRFERAAIAAGHTCIAGIDEAGRGPWAGPVVAAAVILDQSKRRAKGVNDSKKLGHDERCRLHDVIMASAQVGVGIVNVECIDRDNILRATFAAMTAAIAALPSRPSLALIDGNRAPELACATQTIVEGDGLSLSIAAASIVAKVTRDRIMIALDGEFPGYGFARHKGYGTPEHQAALSTLGPCVQHRRSWAPIRHLVEFGTLPLFSDEELAQVA
jgi:ribonuclease HII